MSQNPQETTNITRQQTRPIRVTILSHFPAERRIIATALVREEITVAIGMYQEAWKSGGYGPLRPKYQIALFGDPAEALSELLVAENPVPDILFLDLNLPKIDGLQVLRRCKEAIHLQHMPVIVIISEDNQVLTRLKGTLAGVSSYLVRPVKETVIRDTTVEIEQTALQNSDIWSK